MWCVVFGMECGVAFDVAYGIVCGVWHFCMACGVWHLASHLFAMWCFFAGGVCSMWYFLFYIACDEYGICCMTCGVCGRLFVRYVVSGRWYT